MSRAFLKMAFQKMLTQKFTHKFSKEWCFIYIDDFSMSVSSHTLKSFFFLLRDFLVHFPVIFRVSEVFNIMWVSFNYHVTLSSRLSTNLVEKKGIKWIWNSPHPPFSLKVSCFIKTASFLGAWLEGNLTFIFTANELFFKGKLCWVSLSLVEERSKKF